MSYQICSPYNQHSNNSTNLKLSLTFCKPQNTDFPIVNCIEIHTVSKANARKKLKKVSKKEANFSFSSINGTWIFVTYS